MAQAPSQESHQNLSWDLNEVRRIMLFLAGKEEA